MQTLEALNTLEKTVSSAYSFAYKYENFLSVQTDENIKNFTDKIKNNFEVTYTKKIKISAMEIRELKLLIVDFLKNKKNNFNSHYIQLLAWHIDDIKVMSQKTKIAAHSVSFLEYAPNPLLLFSVTNKIFQLFEKPNIEPAKVATALLLNYLNNYERASSRFKTVLRRYLKSIKYIKDVDIFFNFITLGQFLTKKRIDYKKIGDGEKFLRSLLELSGVNPVLLETKYFNDALKQTDGGERINYGA